MSALLYEFRSAPHYVLKKYFSISYGFKSNGESFNMWLWNFPSGLATLIAGILAISGAIIAYITIIKRIKIDEKNRKNAISDRQRSVAISFLAELKLWHTALDRQNFELENRYSYIKTKKEKDNTEPIDYLIPKSSPISLSNYQALISHLGDIGSPNVAMLIAKAAHQIIERNEWYSKDFSLPSENFDVTEGYKVRLARLGVWIEDIQNAANELIAIIENNK